MQLVADANVLLSALIGGRASRVFQHPEVDKVFTAAATMDEVHEYAARLAREKGLHLDTLLLALAALPVIVVQRPDYQRHISEAKRRIAHRDPDDVDILALALSLGLPIWSNDNDFRDARIEWHTTAQILQMLGIRA